MSWHRDVGGVVTFWEALESARVARKVTLAELLRNGIQVGSARVHLSGDGCNHRDSNVCPACAELTDDEVAALREYFERIADV